MKLRPSINTTLFSTHAATTDGIDEPVLKTDKDDARSVLLPFEELSARCVAAHNISCR